MKSIFAFCFSMLTVISAYAEADKHLFILSGQSNMAGMDTEVSFTPSLKEHFGEDGIIVVKDAKGTTDIRHWYKNWVSPEGVKPEDNGVLYDRLMQKVDASVEGEKVKSVTFIWMQGERDAKLEYGSVYESSLSGLLQQLKRDLNTDDIHVIIGRINDHSLDNSTHPHWGMIRDIQVEFAESLPSGAWVDTDDLNGFDDDIHATRKGFAILGQRFAEKAIGLIERSSI